MKMIVVIASLIFLSGKEIPVPVAPTTPVYKIPSLITGTINKEGHFTEQAEWCPLMVLPTWHPPMAPEVRIVPVLKEHKKSNENGK